MKLSKMIEAVRTGGLSLRRQACGALAPVEAEVGMATCVLEPGHDGPHREAHGHLWLGGDDD